MRTIRVIASCANTLLRRGVVQTLNETKHIKVLSHTDNGDEAIALIKELEPDLVLLGSEQKGTSTAELVHRAKAIKNSIVVLACCGELNIKKIISILEAGADGCLLDDTKPEALISSITTASIGESVLDPNIMEALVKNGHWFFNESKDFPKNPLSEKEFLVLKLGAQGIKSQVIAKKLNMSLSTVKAHWRNIFTKLNVNSRGQAVFKAIKENWLIIQNID